MVDKILHICNTDKFIPSFIYFVEENFDLNKHEFFLFGDHSKYPVNDIKQVKKVKQGALYHFLGYLRVAWKMHKSEKIILHGLSKKKIEKLFWLMPWVLKKTYWIIWGSDLYTYKTARHKKGWKYREFFRRPVIRKMGFLVTYLEGDVRLAREWYGATGKYYECLAYPSNLYKDITNDKQKNTITHVQIGNSADPSNQHIQVLERLEEYNASDVKLFAPLSYGDKKNAECVAEKGKKIFGHKFHAMNKYLTLSEYNKWLSSIDIAIFNHERQQAMGNIITLLGLGKTVYIRGDVSQWDLFKKLGVVCLDFNKNFSLELIDDKQKQKNIDIIKEEFSSERLKSQLNRIFCD